MMTVPELETLLTEQFASVDALRRAIAEKDAAIVTLKQTIDVLNRSLESNAALIALQTHTLMAWNKERT